MVVSDSELSPQVGSHRLARARRVLVMGASGGGKSTFSIELARLLDLPLIHLDRHFWKPGWVESERAEWREKVGQLAARDAWVMDGNYSGTADIRLPRADAVILLDPPLWTSLFGVYSRAIRGYGEQRPDLADGCPETLPDRQFLWFVLSYKWRSRPKLLRMIAAQPHLTLQHLKSRGEFRELLEEIRRAV